MKNGDMPVTPVFNDHGKIQSFRDAEGNLSMATGLTKREAFAMAAMQGILSSNVSGTTEEFVSHSVVMADALLKELSNES